MVKSKHFTAAGLLLMTLAAGNAYSGSIAYLGPAGSWTHQACLDLYGAADLAPATRDELFAGYANGKFEKACVPVTTSVVGVTPYMDAVLEIPDVLVVAEYPKMLGYSLLVRPGTKRDDIKEVFAHPVAFEEVKPWVDKEMPNVKRTDAASGGAAAQTVANSPTLDKASFGPQVGASVYKLEALVNGIEEGPHNVTRWWVLGRTMPAPTGNDKTSLIVDSTDADFGKVLTDFSTAGVQILTVYERPSKKTLDAHRYLIEVAGHARVGAVSSFLANHPSIKLLGSYPRK